MKRILTLALIAACGLAQGQTCTDEIGKLPAGGSVTLGEACPAGGISTLFVSNYVPDPTVAAGTFGGLVRYDMRITFNQCRSTDGVVVHGSISGSVSESFGIWNSTTCAGLPARAGDPPVGFYGGRTTGAMTVNGRYVTGVTTYSLVNGAPRAVTVIDGLNTIQVGEQTYFGPLAELTRAGLQPSGVVTPQQGWWWNPAESGRGFFIEASGNTAFFASYLYASTGRATWYAASLQRNGATFAGTLDAYSGGQSLTGNYVPPTPSLGAGNSIAVTFSDPTHATLQWAGGTTPIEHFGFADNSDLPAFQPQAGWWWNPAESGRGFSLEVQGGTMFISGYMYDTAGNPLWYLSAGTLTNLSYQSAWTQYANGQTLGGSYAAPSVINGSVGALTIQFTNSTAGVMTLPNGRTIEITRFLF